ncbi:MAG: hypothetical protein L6Q76_28025 [Polyangiaceae bacterium]|nr:hypothetical protein [Polyangiaceae bacterium]
MGGGAAGIAMAIPVVSWLNALFLIVLAGAALAVHLHLAQNPNDRLTAQDAALCGGIAGVVATFVAMVVGFVTGFILGPLVGWIYTAMPLSLLKLVSWQYSWGFVGIPIRIILNGGMGALGGFLAMQMFFKDRLQ